MDKARKFPCQTAGPGARTGLAARFACALLFLLASLFAPAAAEDKPPSPAPTPPAWQQELAALQVMRVPAALAPPDQKNAQGQTMAEHTAEAFIQLGTKYPAQPEIQKACGDFFFETGESDRAFDYWLRAQKLDPANGDVAASLGEAYLKAGDTRAAAQEFQRAVDARPEQADYHSALANVLYLFRHDLVDPPALPDAEAVLGRALEQFRLAAQLAPQDRVLAKAYAESFYIQAKPDWTQALAAWQAVLALSAEDPDFANSHLARVSLRMKRPQEAEVYLDRLRRPDFMELKSKLDAQARKMAAESPAVTPPR